MYTTNEPNIGITITAAVENDTGVDVHTDLGYDDEGKHFASYVAAPFYDLGHTPVRVYAASGDLLLERHRYRVAPTPRGARVHRAVGSQD